jgi:hypothetical protein
MRNQMTCDVNRFEERDIDLLLAEELRVNQSFSEWFAHRAAPELSLRTPAFRTRISVVQDGSESDVIACFRREDGGVHRVFVEDKITAKMMPEQLERYIRRAEQEKQRGEAASFSVVLFSPQSYRAQLPEGVAQITFEEAASQLSSNDGDPRASYKAAFLTACLPLRSLAAKNAQVPITDPFVVEWWDAVYRMLDREFPNKFLPPSTRYPRSVYFAPRVAGMPNYLRFDFKGHLGEVDLSFKNISFQELSAACSILTVPGVLVENQKSSSVRINSLSSFRISDGHRIIDTHVRAAFASTLLLAQFWRENRLVFDELAGN